MFTIFLTEIQPVCLHFGKIEKSINKGKKNSKNNFWASNFYDKLIFNSFGPKNGNIKIPINFYPHDEYREGQEETKFLSLSSTMLKL